MNGLPPQTTGSTSERFTVSAPHWNAADGRPALRYRIDGRAWRNVPRRKVVATGRLGLGPHRIAVRTANAAGSTTRRFAWRVVPLPAPVACQGVCWAPPHLDSTGHPMRWDWQIGRVTPLKRTGARAVDIYDIDGFLTKRSQIAAIHTSRFHKGRAVLRSIGESPWSRPCRGIPNRPSRYSQGSAAHRLTSGL